MKYNIYLGRKEEFIGTTRDRNHIPDLILDHYRKEGYKQFGAMDWIMLGVIEKAEELLHENENDTTPLCELFKQSKAVEVDEVTYEDLVYEHIAPEIGEDYDLIEAANFEIHKGAQAKYGEPFGYHLVVEITETKEVARIRRKLQLDYSDKYIPNENEEEE